MKRQLLKEGTSNFGRLDPLPLLVFYTYDEILYRMIYDSDYPNKDDYYDDEGNFDSSAYEEAIEKFEEDYFNKIDICILDDYSVDGLEDDLDDLNRTLEDKANDLEDEAWQRDNSDEGISREEYDKLMDTAASLHDIATFSIEPGHYEASYIDNKYPESYNDLTEEDKKFVMNKIKEIKKKYNLTALGVSYRFSNGETGYHKVEMEESVELDDVDESIEGTPKVGDYKKKVSKHLKSNKKGARGNNDGFGKTHNTDPEKNMKIFNHMMGSDTPSTSGGETSVGGEGSCCESVELDEKKTSKYESEHFIAQCEFKPGRYRNYYYVHLIDKKANNNCFTNEIVREYAKGSYGWINRPYEGFDYKMALLDACRKYGLSDDKIEQLRKCTDFQSTLDLFDKLEQEEVKEGAEGKRVPGKEYVSDKVLTESKLEKTTFEDVIDSKDKKYSKYISEIEDALGAEELYGGNILEIKNIICHMTYNIYKDGVDAEFEFQFDALVDGDFDEDEMKPHWIRYKLFDDGPEYIGYYSEYGPEVEDKDAMVMYPECYYGNKAIIELLQEAGYEPVYNGVTALLEDNVKNPYEENESLKEGKNDKWEVSWDYNYLPKDAPKLFLVIYNDKTNKNKFEVEISLEDAKKLGLEDDGDNGFGDFTSINDLENIVGHKLKFEKVTEALEEATHRKNGVYKIVFPKASADGNDLEYVYHGWKECEDVIKDLRKNKKGRPFKVMQKCKDGWCEVDEDIQYPSNESLNEDKLNYSYREITSEEKKDLSKLIGKTVLRKISDNPEGERGTITDITVDKYGDTRLVVDKVFKMYPDEVLIIDFKNESLTEDKNEGGWKYKLVINDYDIYAKYDDRLKNYDEENFYNDYPEDDIHELTVEIGVDSDLYEWQDEKWIEIENFRESLKEGKEGAEGHKVPGKEYVIYDCSLENGKKAPIVAIRSTYTEAQWYCNKPGNFDKDLGIEEVPKGRFHKGDDFYGPFDGETWELKESKLNEVGDEERVEHYQAELDKLGATEEECNKYIKIADNYEAKAEKHFITYEQMDEVAKAMGLEQMSDNELARAWKVCYYTLDRESFKADDSEDLERWRKYSDAASAFAEVINREARKRKSSGHYSPRKGESLDVKEVIGNDFIVDPDGLLYLKGDAMERLVAEAKDRDIPFDEFIKMGFSSSDSRGRYGSLVFSEYESQFKELWAEYDELLKQAGNR